MNVKSVVSKINRRKLTNNTQRVAHVLLQANGSWVNRKTLERCANSAAARARDLRKAEFGSFKVDCESALTLKKQGHKTDYFYRISPKSVTTKQVKAVFRT